MRDGVRERERDEARENAKEYEEKEKSAIANPNECFSRVDFRRVLSDSLFQHGQLHHQLLHSAAERLSLQSQIGVLSLESLRAVSHLTHLARGNLERE